MAVRKQPSSDYAAASFAALVKRLPTNEWLSVADVASACDLSIVAVRAHMDCGNFHAMNFGASESQPYRRIYRPSVVDFFKRRLGVES